MRRHQNWTQKVKQVRYKAKLALNDCDFKLSLITDSSQKELERAEKHLRHGCCSICTELIEPVDWLHHDALGVMASFKRFPGKAGQ